MITNEQLKDIIKECKDSKVNITTRDIAYVVLCNEFEDDEVAYKCIFGADRGFSLANHRRYKESNNITFLKQYVDFIQKKQANRKSKEDITFEENKAYMLKLKKDTEKAMERGEIDKKDGLKILADLSVKLNDKFQVREERVEQVVHVFSKFNAICQCGREIYIPTKEDMMKKYNLVEK